MADHRHKRDTNARRSLLHPRPRSISPRFALVAGPLAVLATTAAVTFGVVSADPGAGDIVASTSPDAGLAAADLGERREVVSRSSSRSALEDEGKLARVLSRQATNAALRRADTKLWTTAALNLWTEPGEAGRQVGELDAARKVLVTGRELFGRVEVVVKGESRWVTDGYLSADKPLAAAAGLSMAPCPDPSVENGLTSSAVYVYRSVCAAFPQITSYGGWDAHGEHSSGRALDIMTSDVALGTAIAEFLRSNAAALNLYDIIWRQHIWTPVRAGEGWRYMSSRGSATADHYDHVHVATY
ncbi:MAG: mucin-2 protein [Actinobacteria bacterium]|uniref:Unannotated protein n=1 Tax=freshwater metagenome TaxID=449393 RepID=A0A6J6QGZ5_9ZZZZ|nr:mucin-2 protein [Actinomycetota bacterium]